MSKDKISSIDVCPINIKAFGAINRTTSNIEATLLYSKLKFHQKNSKISVNNKTWIYRTRRQLAEWFNLGEKKIDSLLSILERNGLIEKKLGLWYGQKRLLLHASEELTDVPVNHQYFTALLERTGSIRSAVVFSKIAFAFSNTKIEHENKKWCSFKKEYLADWMSISIRTLDKVLYELIRKGIILKKNFLWNGNMQSHYHIPDYAIQVIQKNCFSIENQPTMLVNYKQLSTGEIAKNVKKISELPNQLCKPAKSNISNAENEPKNPEKETKTSPLIYRLPPAKKGKSIRIRSNTKETNNNTQEYLSTTDGGGDITLIKAELSLRQEKYLEGALKNTIARSSIAISNPKELLDQLRFAITNPQQHKTIISFPHVVSRFMKIIAERNWKTPIGFYQYSEQGKHWKQQQMQKEKSWDNQKIEEIKAAEALYKNIQRREEKVTNAEITHQAKIIAERIVQLASSSYKETPEKKELVQSMLTSLQGFLYKGADKEIVRKILSGGGI